MNSAAFRDITLNPKSEQSSQEFSGSSECDSPNGLAKFGIIITGAPDPSRVVDIEIKNSVLTPAWTFEKNVSEPLTSFVKHDYLQKMIDMHYELEVTERRIDFSEEDKYGHPALVVKARDEQGVHDLTRREKRLRSNYQQENPIQTVPIFWVKRIWDNPESLLNEKQTETLKQKMIMRPPKQEIPFTMVTRQRSYQNSYNEYSDSDDAPVIKKKYVPPPPLLDENGNIIKRKRGRPRKKPLPSRQIVQPRKLPFLPSPHMIDLRSPFIDIPIVSFETDDEDILSDWDEL